MRVSTTLIGACAALLVVSVAGVASAEAAEGTPTFAKDVAPILYENCVSCHRPNHLAPMSLITYADARWMTRQIAQLSRKQIVQAVSIGHWPRAAGELLTEKLIHRRNQLVEAFDLVGTPSPSGSCADPHAVAVHRGAESPASRARRLSVTRWSG